MAQLRKIVPLVTVGLMLLFLFLNCQGQNNLPVDEGITLSCSPSGSPCLKYKLNLANLNTTKGSMSVLLQGSAYEGVASDTKFSTQCSRVNGSTAFCPFNSTVTASVSSDGPKGDGRSLSITLITDSNIRSKKLGTLSKSLTSSLDNEPENFCFLGDDDKEYYDGTTIPFSELEPCSDE